MVAEKVSHSSSSSLCFMILFFLFLNSQSITRYLLCSSAGTPSDCVSSLPLAIFGAVYAIKVHC